MTPRCCRCGRFTTFLMERYWVTPGAPWEGQDDRWYCERHAPQAPL